MPSWASQQAERNDAAQPGHAELGNGCAGLTLARRVGAPDNAQADRFACAGAKTSHLYKSGCAVMSI